MSDTASHPENGNGSAEPIGPTLGRVPVLPFRNDPRRGGLRLWARQNFSRKQLLTSLKTMLWVAPLTLLIWIYAAREQQFTSPLVTIPIEVFTNDPSRYVVTLRKPEEPLITATLTGPRSGVEAVMHSWDPKYGDGPVRIEVDRNLGTGDRRIDASIIGNDLRFGRDGVGKGVSVSSCQPAWLDVVIDQIVEMQVEVKAVDIPSNVASIAFSPSTVTVRGPKGVLEKAAAAGTLHVDATVDYKQASTGANPSGPSPAVRLSLPIKDKDVAIVGTPTVQAAVTFATGKTLTLPTVTVEVTTTKQIMDNYRFDFDPTLPDVTVSGSQDKLDLLTSDPSKYRKATFEVTQDDISSIGVGGSKAVKVEWKFPPGVEWKSGPDKVTFTVVDRRNPSP